MIDPHQCTRCFAGRMNGTHSRPVAQWIERYRRCKQCGHVDRVLIEPEKIVKYLPVVRHNTQRRETTLEQTKPTRDNSEVQG